MANGGSMTPIKPPKPHTKLELFVDRMNGMIPGYPAMVFHPIVFFHTTSLHGFRADPRPYSWARITTLRSYSNSVLRKGETTRAGGVFDWLTVDL